MTTIRHGAPAPRHRKKLAAGLLCLTGLFIIGDIDYLTGYQISLLVFYILPVGFAAIYVGPLFAISLALLSVAISISTDFWAGLPASDIPVMFWNASIALAVFLIVVGVLHVLSRLLIRLELSVEDRNRSLLDEMSERARLEREIIDLSENEQRRLGQELHDIVCQELASVSIAAHMLTRELSALEHKETGLAREVATMTDHALETTRRVARGFFTTDFDSAGLEEALGEIARHTEEQGHVSCLVHWQDDLIITNRNTVIHLFRIAQQAMQNAAKHAAASRITVTLARQEESLQLTIEDDGRGLSPSADRDKGLGLRIMAYRAGLLGGEFKVVHPKSGGTRIVCLVPLRRLNGPLVKAP